ncbi:MAG: leucine-rich repeat domain-containing protein, partial [Clostridia bacterium]|nr:leucine-rich repeat domain-containing protein [Clostridia bacterium]
CEIIALVKMRFDGLEKMAEKAEKEDAPFFALFDRPASPGTDGTTASNPVVRFAFAGDSAFFAIFENAKGNWALEISGQGIMKNFPYVCEKNIKAGYTFSPMYYIGEVEEKIDGVEPEAKILSIKVADGITTVGNYIFYKCTKATALTLPEGITSIGQGAFRNCQRLKTITLPESVTKIEKTAFVSCKTLTELYIPEGVTVVGSGIFEKCDKIDSLVVKTKSAEAIAVISAEYPTVTIVSDF